MSDPTQEHLKALVNYDPETGVFTWRERKGKMAAGSAAGTTRPDGRHMIGIDGRRYLSSRLAWLYVHGELPPSDVDHKDRDRGNDRISNLRKATRTQNNANGKPRVRFRGVSRHMTSRLWRARIKIDGKETRLGYFVDPEDAARAYDAAARKAFGEFARTNFP